MVQGRAVDCIALINAEEAGVTSLNIESPSAAPTPLIRRKLLGLEGSSVLRRAAARFHAGTWIAAGWELLARYSSAISVPEPESARPADSTRCGSMAG